SAADSTVESEGVLDIVARFFQSFGFPLEMTDHIIRKLAHFSEFALIGGLLTSCAYSFDRFKPYRYIFTVLFTGLFTAVIDEAIQLFSDGRSGQITDVLLDFSGVLTGTLIMLLFYKIYINIRTKSKRDKKENGTD
ncbi:MAG: VanZ family protein, partial [Oscillospiraceae bacterium]|nr:VanZ family protein [Oscillospiraceae bacterium]